MGKLYVIAGHGAGDPGAVGNGYNEAERVRALADAIKARGGDSVVLLDTSRNWYADKGINSLNIAKGDWLVELHMDSASASARGGHVIIKAGIGGADQYDKALANAIANMFPGRSQTIVERSDLANPNRAAARGINYRLVENGFITNAEDVKVFNDNLDKLADLYLEAFGLKSNGSTAPSTPTPTPAPSAPVSGGSSSGSASTGTSAKGPIDGKLLLDSDAGVKTFHEWALQLGLSGSDADGYLNYQYTGNKKYLKNVSSALYKWYNGCPGSATVKAIQRRIGSKNVDGVWGAVDTENLKSYMKSKWGYKMTSDGYGIFGKNTAYNVQHSLNEGFWRS